MTHDLTNDPRWLARAAGRYLTFSTQSAIDGDRDTSALQLDMALFYRARAIEASRRKN